MTLAEEDPDYAGKVAAYLARSHSRRLPWGCIVSGGHLTFTSTSAERTQRAEMGETAIRVLSALGVSATELAALDTLEDQSPAALLAKLKEMK